MLTGNREIRKELGAGASRDENKLLGLGNDARLKRYRLISTILDSWQNGFLENGRWFPVEQAVQAGGEQEDGA